MWEEKVLDRIQTWGLEFVRSELQACSCRTMVRGAGGEISDCLRTLQAKYISALNLPLNGSRWCCPLDSLENVNGCWVWGGNVTGLYASLVLRVFSRVHQDVSYCDNHVCSQGPMII